MIFYINLRYHSINCYSVSKSAFTDLVHLDNTNSDSKLTNTIILLNFELSKESTLYHNKNLNSNIKSAHKRDRPTYSNYLWSIFNK